MIETIPSPNFGDRRGCDVDMLVLHYTGMASAQAALERLCDPSAQVSAHYLVDEDGRAARLVDEGMRAWHAGVAFWRGETDINSRSIGIELVNPGHEFGYRDFPDAQMDALIGLCGEILSRHSIPARNVVGHSDVAPVRKADPGERFDWRRLANEGIGIWPGELDGVTPVNEEDVASVLAEIGYDVSDRKAALTAFQRHFTPHRLDGAVDTVARQAIAAVRALI